LHEAQSSCELTAAILHCASERRARAGEDTLAALFGQDYSAIIPDV